MGETDTDRMRGASAAVRKFEYHWPADCLAEAADTIDHLRAHVEKLEAAICAHRHTLVDNPFLGEKHNDAHDRLWSLLPFECHDRDEDDEHPCIGGDYCGRSTNGYFEAGSHGPGWYCGWCEAIPA
jgi:hypothetical protein